MLDVVVLVSGSGTLLQALIDDVASGGAPYRLVGVGSDRTDIAGLARANEADIRRAYDTVCAAPRHRIHTFLATSDIHMEHKLRMSKAEVR